MVRMRTALLALAAIVLALTGCSSSTTATTPSASFSTTTYPLNEQAVQDWADWYRSALKEGNDPLPEKFTYAPKDYSPTGEWGNTIQALCHMSAADASTRQAAAEAIKNDGLYYGDATFAASAIVQARNACGL